MFYNQDQELDFAEWEAELASAPPCPHDGAPTLAWAGWPGLYQCTACERPVRREA